MMIEYWNGIISSWLKYKYQNTIRLSWYPKYPNTPINIKNTRASSLYSCHLSTRTTNPA